jgi:hypothetical protein
VSVQFIPTDAAGARYQREVRGRRKTMATAYAGNDLQAPRRRTADGWAVSPRNGMPEPMRRDITDTAACGCIRRLNLSVMDWELHAPCGGHQ